MITNANHNISLFCYSKKLFYRCGGSFAVILIKKTESIPSSLLLSWGRIIILQSWQEHGMDRLPCTLPLLCRVKQTLLLQHWFRCFIQIWYIGKICYFLSNIQSFKQTNNKQTKKKRKLLWGHLLIKDLIIMSYICTKTRISWFCDEEERTQVVKLSSFCFYTFLPFFYLTCKMLMLSLSLAHVHSSTPHTLGV